MFHLQKLTSSKHPHLNQNFVPSEFPTCFFGRTTFFCSQVTGKHETESSLVSPTSNSNCLGSMVKGNSFKKLVTTSKVFFSIRGCWDMVIDQKIWMNPLNSHVTRIDPNSLSIILKEKIILPQVNVLGKCWMSCMWSAAPQLRGGQHPLLLQTQ